MPLEWSIDGKGRTFAYGLYWGPVQALGGKGQIMPRPRYDIEMRCYRFLRGLERNARFVPPPGIKDAYHHFKAICVELFGAKDSIWPWEWNPNAERMLEMKLKHPFLMIGGSRSSGKSEFLVVWAFVNYLADPIHTKCLITSVSLKAAKTRIWGKMTMAWQQAGRRLAQIWGKNPADGESLLPGKLMSNGIIKYVDQGVETETAGLELVAGDAEGAKDSTPKIQGTKADRLFVLLDELSELDHGLMNTIVNNLFKAVGCDVTGAFNPNSHFDPAGKECEPYWSEEKKGWTTVDTTYDEWPIRRGYFIRFSGAKSPNVVSGVNRWNGLMTKEDYDLYVQQNGEKGKGYWQQYAAFWSPTGSVESIYDENELESALAMVPITTEWIAEPTPCAFLDPSFAHGGDGAAAAFGLCGDAKIRGKTITVLSLTDVIKLDAEMDVKLDKPTQVARAFVRECKVRNVSPKNAGLDSTGAGQSLYSLIALEWSGDLLKVGFGDTASDLPLSKIDRTPAKEKYVRLVSEIWYGAKPLIRSGQFKGLPPDVVIEMCARTYETQNGRIKVESKEDMKARALRSPDAADSALGLCYLAKQRLGLMPEERALGTLIGSAYRRGAVSRSVRNLNKCVRPALQFGNGSALWKR